MENLLLLFLLGRMVDVMSIGLVLEGGGTRGAYTAGVLDVLAKAQVEFPAVYGISAGACNALSWISKQPGRNLEIFSYFVPTDAYVSRKNLLRSGNVFGFDYIFGKMFHKEIPFDYQTFFESPIRFRVGATDVETGQAVFFEKEDIDEKMDVIRASSALPFLSKMVTIQGRKYMDGGISMSIPVQQSICDGNRFHVVVLTRDASYVRKGKPDFPKVLIQMKYRKYPNFVRTLLNRPKEYREELAYCKKLEEKGKAIVLRPSVPITIGRCEKDAEKLVAVYELGVQDCQARLEEIKTFVEKAKD